MKRRDAIKQTALASAFGLLSPFKNQKEKPEKKSMLKGNINHSVCDWCYPSLSLEELCVEAKRIGLVGIDLVKPNLRPDVKTIALFGPGVTYITK